RPGQETWFGFRRDSPAKTFGFAYDAAPTATPQRMVSDAEKRLLQSATTSNRQLTNGDFSNGLTGWEREEGAANFRIPPSDTATALTTYGANKEADRGRLFQCFQVPTNATELQFKLSGGADSANLYVALWDGNRLVRKMTARNDNAPFQVRWNIETLRGKTITLEIVDHKTGPWAFLAAGGFAFGPEKSL
ncbi:MAG: hypothetical protein JWN14_3521, partial [Chthonomonadales bacterium]|nr:hypothetical protein [Chthonomonadales bacterium]